VDVEYDVVNFDNVNEEVCDEAAEESSSGIVVVRYCWLKSEQDYYFGVELAKVL